MSRVAGLWQAFKSVAHSHLSDLTTVAWLWCRRIFLTHVIYAAALIFALYVWHWDLFQSIHLVKIIALLEMALMGISTLQGLWKEGITPHGGFFYLSFVATFICFAVFAVLGVSFVLEIVQAPNFVREFLAQYANHYFAENLLFASPIYVFLLFNVCSYCFLGTSRQEELRKNRVMYIISCVDTPCAFAITVLFLLAYTPKTGATDTAIEAFVSGALALLVIVSNTVNRALEVLEARYLIVKQSERPS